MRFYEVNCNKAPGDYDAVGRRKGAEPDFSYADKVVVPKIFNLATNKVEEKSDKPQKPVSTIPKKVTEGAESKVKPAATKPADSL